MSKAKNTAKKNPPAPKARAVTAAPDDKGALMGALDAMNQQGQDAQDRRAGEQMPSNDSTMHSGLHDGHDSQQHVGDIHDADAFPENWTPPAELDAPEPRSGFVQRWVRMSLKGQNDGNNLAAMARQGWRPRTLESVPESDRKNYSTMKDPRTAGMFLVNKDVVLCEMPKRLFDQMSAYFAAKRKGQVTSLVDRPLAASAVAGAEKHGFGAPHVAERSSHVTLDRVPIVAADK